MKKIAFLKSASLIFVAVCATSGLVANSQTLRIKLNDDRRQDTAADGTRHGDGALYERTEDAF